jgi:pimeloyl-ACP methyl ester carboxylesterase
MLLHGVGTDGRMFTPIVDRLYDDAVVGVWYLPGYGAKRLDGPLTFPGLASALAADFDKLRAKPTVLLGHSIGGMLALEFAATFPHRVRALILSATTPAFGSRDGSFQREFLKARLAPLDAGRSMAELAQEAAPRLVGSAAPPEAAVEIARLMGELPETSFRAGLACLVTFDRRNDLAKIDPVWFGIVVIITAEIGLITPPIGLNVLVLSTLFRDIETRTAYRGVHPFLIAEIIGLGIIVAFPAITTVLPSMMK